MKSYVDRIRPDSFGITTYLENLRRGQYQIPTFQREVVWDLNLFKKLWDSIYKYYPLGSILVWRTRTKLQMHRQIGGHPLDDSPDNREFQYLLDGQQRTTALLTSIYGGTIKGLEGQDLRLFVDLSIGDAEEIDEESWPAKFLFWHEIDDREGKYPRNSGRNKSYNEGLIVKLEDIAHQYNALEENLENNNYSYNHPARRQLQKFKHVLDNYKLSFIELRGIEVAEVCQIFERINQAGQPLSIFDIVVAKTFRPETDTDSGFYLRGLFNDFQHELKTKGSSFAAVDEMTLLQIFAVIVRKNIQDSGVHNITERYLNVLSTEHFEKTWEDGKKAIQKVFDFLDNHLHLPGPALVPYRYFYMSLASYFFRNDAPDYDFLKRYFWYYSFHLDDLLRNTTYLRDHVDRLQKAKEGEEFHFDRFLIDKDRLRTTSYSSRGRLSRAVLALYANQDPRDWGLPDRSVLTHVYYALTDHPNLHHIFPLDFCEKHLGEYGKYANSLLNIAYLTQITNLKISNTNPLLYLKDYITPQFAEIQRSHLLPGLLVEWSNTAEMPENALEIFVDARLELLLSKLRGYLSDIPFEVIDTQSVATDGD